MTKALNDGLFHKGHRWMRFSAAERFEQNYIPVTESGCWIWIGNVSSRGYGRLSTGKRGSEHVLTAHRIAWEMIHGPIPEGMQVNHKCDVRCCVNPNHLYLGTHADNMADVARRGRAANWRKTHCPKGHEYEPENIYWHKRKNGVGRECRYCTLEADRRRKLARKEQRTF